MTINLTDVTFDLLVAEQLHDIVPCRRCDRSAHWVVQCDNCGHACFRCSSHRDDFEARRWLGIVACRPCKAAYPSPPTPLPWVAL